MNKIAMGKNQVNKTPVIKLWFPTWPVDGTRYVVLDPLVRQAPIPVSGYAKRYLAQIRDWVRNAQPEGL